MWRNKRKGDPMPWYRRPEYKGNLAEAQKRKLDAFRMQSTHPSARFEDLPDEVQSYIAAMEVDIYDLRQEKAFFLAILCSLFGIAVLLHHYGKLLSLSHFWAWTCGLLLLIAPWFVYWYDWNKIAEEFDAPVDERFRREWEVHYLARFREEQDEGGS